ncbi:MAG: XRE family transcriptional regulator [Acidimicrobiales bacterium]
MAKLKNYRQLQAGIDRDPVRRARVDAERAAALREQLEYSLAELRRAREITQEALAEALDTTQSGVSRLEHQRDLHLSTLLRYVEALGGRVEITAVFDDERLSIAPN